MNRIIITLVAVFMAMLLGACGQKEPKTPEVTTNEAAMEQPKQDEQVQDAVAPKDEQPAVNDSMSEDNQADKSASLSNSGLTNTADASDSVAPAQQNDQPAANNAPAKDDDADDDSDEDDDEEEDDDDDQS